MRKNRRGRGEEKTLQKTIEQLFINNPFKVYSMATIIKMLSRKVRKNQRIELVKTVKEMVEKGIISQPRSGEFKFNTDSLKTVEGTVVTITPTAAYIKVNEFEGDVLVERRDLGNALVGDVVNLSVYRGGRNGKMKGICNSVVKRSEKRYVGVIEIGESFAFVTPNSRDMQHDIFIPKKDINNSLDGELVVVEIVEFNPTQPNPVGRVLKALGKVGSNNAEIHAILEEFSLPYEFDKAVLEESEHISEMISNSEIAKRRDFRDTVTFTIDPFDAKDFDDALSIKQLGENRWEIGIHIADVTHYIDENSLLEENAKERATSVYLVDRVVPMLPERLSNGLCSLRPNEEKLCFSVVLTMDNDAKIFDKWYGRTIINSNKRFTYEEAQSIIEGGEGELKDEVLKLHNLALILRKERFNSGSIGFERAEFKFKLDENSVPVGVYTKEQKDSNHLVEEFMLLANKAVAEFVALSSKPNRTFVYRVHNEPDGDKYNQLCKFVGKFGYSLKQSSNNKVITQQLNMLLNEVKGQKSETLISTLALRSMAKAIYTTANIGHYGLGFDNYTHFTSPIRRYPDMMVHRLLQHYIDGGSSASQEYYEDLCDHSSKREQRASEAERASIKYKMAEFMSDKVGIEFNGTISGVTERGIYVELADTHIEGMVAIQDMRDDYYVFDAENYRVVGRNNQEKLMLGDKVKIEVLRVDMSRKLIDFTMVSHFDYETDFEYFFKN